MADAPSIINNLDTQGKKNQLMLGRLTAEYGDGDTITSIACSPLTTALKEGDVIMINGQSMTLSAGAAASATSISINSLALSQTMMRGNSIEIDQENLFTQYQRKTSGQIAGMPVTADTLGPITYSGGKYTIKGAQTQYIKILPRDFMINEDGSDEPLYFKDATNTGLQVNNADQEMIATVNIPVGCTATEVKVWGSVTTKVVEVYEAGVNANGKGSAIGSGTTNGSAISITSTAHTQYNYLLIIVKVTATSNRVYGGQVTLT